MVKILCTLGCVLSAFMGGCMVRLALNDTVMWLPVFLLVCSFGCFWAELNRD